MSATLDANILIDASNTADPVHRAARDLVGRLAAGPELVYLFWPFVMAYLRIVTHGAILPRPLAPAIARENVAALLSRPHVQAIGELDGFWDGFGRVAASHTRGNDVADAHLVALMHQHGVRLLFTRDRGFRRFDGIEVVDPFA